MSRTGKPRYRISPSLLNKFQDYLDSELLWMQFYGNSEEPAISLEDYETKCEKELLDACNRVPFVSEAASKGTALNEIVDCIIDSRPQREDMKVQRMYDADVIGEKTILANNHLIGLKAELDGFVFPFDINLVNELTDYFFGSICQHRCEATIETSFGPVIVYGDADYIRRDVVYDLKTTSKYEYGKFDKGWQKYVYPYALIESGELTTVSGFEYTVVPLTGGNSKNPLLSGTIYREWNDFSFDDAKLRLRAILESFIPWIEAHRESIIHPRIFNQS